MPQRRISRRIEVETAQIVANDIVRASSGHRERAKSGVDIAGGLVTSSKAPDRAVCLPEISRARTTSFPSPAFAN